MSLPAPLFEPGDPVYVRESAGMGFLEGYLVYEVGFSGAKPIYTLTPGQMALSTMTVGDRITGPKSVPLALTEDELCTVCEALDLVITSLQEQLAAAETQRTRLACQGST